MFSKKKKPEKREEDPAVVGWKPGMEPVYKHVDGKIFVENCGMDYEIMQEADFLKFRDFADDATEASWHLRHSKHGVYVWDRPSQDKGSSVNVLKLFSEFPGVPPQVMYDCLHDADYRSTWDHSMGEGYNICHLDANNDVGYYMLKLPAVVANRDFCNERSWRNVDNRELIIMNHSVPHERCPPTKAVRGQSIISGYLIRPHGSGSSVTYVSQSDPKGWIPSAVVNTLLTSQGPNLIEKLKGAAKAYPEWKEKHSPNERPWMTDPQPWSKPQPNKTIEWFAARNNTTVEAIIGQASTPPTAAPASQPSTQAPAAEAGAPPAAKEEKEEAKGEEEEKKEEAKEEAKEEEKKEETTEEAKEEPKEETPAAE